VNRASALARLHAVAAAAVPLTMLPARAVAQDKTRIVLVGTANDSGGEMFYAEDRGLYKKAGLDVKVQVLNNPGASVAAVIGGTAQVSTLTIPGIALARQRGIPIVIIAPASLYSSKLPTSGIFVLKDSPIATAADLNGKTVAIRDIGNMSYYGAAAWIDKNGGDSKTIKWVEIPDPAALAAMQSGRIDAASVSEPALDDAIHGPNARLLAACYDAIAPSFMIAAYFSTAAFAQAHPRAVRAFSQAIIEAGIWANHDRAASAKILAKYSGVPVPPTNTRVTYAEQMRPADAQPVLDLLERYGVLKKKMAASELFAPEIPTAS
jgi:NitT/TauT family transport system substrate-binding protein